MDVAVFGPLKSSYRKIVHDWRLKNGKPLVKKRDFSSVLEQAVRSIKPETIQSGFRKCGLYPWNPRELTKSLLLKETPNPDIDSMASEKLHQSGKNQAKTALKLIRQHVGSEKIELFEASHEWSGCIEDKSLFLLWKAIKQTAEETTQEANETTDFPLGSSQKRPGSDAPPMTHRE